jgi:CheY-like chemotaxis protein
VLSRLRLLPAQGLLEVIVEDTGAGIPPEFQRQIFQEFSQIKQRSEDPQKGTGLGLAISKRIVELLGGEIEVESSMGVGSRFSVLFPLGKGGLNQPAPPQTAVGGPGTVPERRRAVPAAEGSRQGRVLLVSEDVVEAGVVGRFLKQRGFAVRTALDVPEALRSLRTEQADLLLLDLPAAADRGLHLLRRIERVQSLKAPPIVVSTRRDLPDELGELLAPRVHSVFARRGQGVKQLADHVAEVLEDMKRRESDRGPVGSSDLQRNADAA